MNKILIALHLLLFHTYCWLFTEFIICLIKLKIKRWKEILFDFEFKIHIQNFLCHYNKTPTEFLLLKLAKKYTSKERIQKEDSVLKIKKKNKK